jgi:hypothetical protein
MTFAVTVTVENEGWEIVIVAIAEGVIAFVVIAGAGKEVFEAGVGFDAVDA